MCFKVLGGLFGSGKVLVIIIVVLEEIELMIVGVIL